MKAFSETQNNLHFLSGGGEMGELIRKFNWAKTPVNTLEQWSYSLRSTLGIVLHSSFPMFLFWGDKLTCFYNDAFMPSLGADGKHPAIGKDGKEVWGEIWEFIGPLINKVISTGEAVWFENQLVPFYRNGKVEDIYWTFSYSPVYGDDGNISGVLVVCNETTKDVIGKKQGEEEKKGKDLAIAAGEFGLFEVDLATNKITTDERFNAIYGFKESVSQEKYIATCHPDDIDIRTNALKQSLSTGVFDYEARFIHQDGSTRWIRSKGNVVYDKNKQPYKQYGVIQETTKQKLFSKRLEENEQQMRSMIESAPFAIAVYIGREMRVEFANQTIMDIWGKGSNVIGKSFRDVLPELDNQQVFVQIDAVFDTGIAFHAKNQHLDLIVDGKVKPYYFNYSLTPLFDSDGRVYGVMNTGVDLTDLNLAQQALKKSEANLRNTILQAPVAMCIFRGATQVVELANDRMFELWGRPAEDIMGKSIFEGLPEVKNQGFEGLLDGVYTTGETVVAQGVPVSLPRNGIIENVYVNFVYEAYREAGGEISGVLAVAVDVTPQVIAHQKIEEVVEKRTKELANANFGLQKSNAELAQFAYIASHDLQEPLRKISTFTQMLENRIEGHLDEQSKNYLTKINTSSARMTALIRDVLAYSELDRQAETFTEVDLNDVVKNITTDFELLIEQKQASIQYKNLPVVKAIPLQMSQLFSNLISNSLKFTRSNIKPLIKITAAKLSADEKRNSSLDNSVDYIKIQVADNGIGFKEEYAEKIFSIFQRLHRKSDYEGTGIGLAMCKKIALNHQGELDAMGTSENGAVFNFVLPL